MNAELKCHMCSLCGHLQRQEPNITNQLSNVTWCQRVELIRAALREDRNQLVCDPVNVLVEVNRQAFWPLLSGCGVVDRVIRLASIPPNTLE